MSDKVVIIKSCHYCGTARGACDVIIERCCPRCRHDLEHVTGESPAEAVASGTGPAT